jgi:hypothetical protein
VATLDTKRLIGEVAKRHGLPLEQDDPVLLTVTLCEFILDEYVEKLNVNLERSFAREIDRAREMAETVIARAGAAVVEQVRVAGVALAADLERGGGPDHASAEIVAARVKRRNLYCIATSIGAAAFMLGVAFARIVCH